MRIDDDGLDAPTPPPLGARPLKAAGAFRTISEVADELHIPQHVLRFWESKFPQVKPLKRGGGRRYYRPDDIGLLRRIADLLYTQGYTIKGVQRLLREGGGRLADNIPPATEEEREQAQAEREVAIEAQEELALVLDAPELAARVMAGAGGAGGVGRRSGEAERLRAMLGAVLVELEALRALLP